MVRQRIANPYNRKVELVRLQYTPPGFTYIDSNTLNPSKDKK